MGSVAVKSEACRRVLITGPSGSGKTHLAAFLADNTGMHPSRIPLEGRTVLHTDDAAKLGWSEASEEVAGWLDRPGPWIIEGVAVPRALRKWRAKVVAAGLLQYGKPRGFLEHRAQPPCDKLIILRSRRPEAGPAKPGHESMEKGLFKVLDEVLEGWPELRRVTEWR